MNSNKSNNPLFDLAAQEPENPLFKLAEQEPEAKVIEEENPLFKLASKTPEEAQVDSYRSTVSRAIGNTVVGELLGDFLLGVKQYGQAKADNIREAQIAARDTIPDTGVSFIDDRLETLEEGVGGTIGTVNEASKDVLNVGSNLATAAAQTPGFVAEGLILNVRNLVAAEGGEKLANELFGAKPTESVVELNRSIGDLIEDTKDTIPGLQETEAEDKATDVMTILGTGIANIRDPKNIEAGLSKIQKLTQKGKQISEESFDYAVGATAATSTEASIPTISQDLLDIEKDSAVNLKGATFLEEYVLGFVGGSVIEAIKPGVKQLAKYIQTPDTINPTGGPSVKEEVDEFKTFMNSLGKEKVLTDPDQTLLTVGEQLDQAGIPDVDLPQVKDWPFQEEAGTSSTFDTRFSYYNSADKYWDYYNVKDNTGKEVGTIAISETDTAIKISRASISDDAKGTGVFSSAYQILADKALSAGKELHSDQEVSASAARLYESLKRKGYTVTEGNAWRNPYSGVYMSNDGEPVFKVTAAPKREAGTAITVRPMDTTDVVIIDNVGGGGGNKPPATIDAQPYFEGGENNLPAVISPRASREGTGSTTLSDYYATKRAVDPETGVAYPQVNTVIIDEFTPLYQAERYRRAVEEGRTQGHLADADFYEAVDVAQSAGTWARTAIGLDENIFEVYKFASDPNNPLYQKVDGIKNLRATIDTAYKNGAKEEDVNKLLLAVDAESDYFSIESNMAKSISDVLEGVAARLTKVPDGTTTMKGFGKDAATFFNAARKAMSKNGDEFPLEELEGMADSLTAQLKTIKMPKSEYKRYKEAFDTIIDDAAHRSHMGKDEALSVIDTYHKEAPWVNTFLQEYSDWNRFLLAERVRAGELSEPVATEWMNLRPHHIPAYKVVKNATGTSERVYKGNTQTKSIKETRKISAKETRPPMETLFEYTQSVGKAIENARIRRTILDYYINNFGDDTTNVFREPPSRIREAITQLEAGTKTSFSAEELLPYSKNQVELPGDKIKFNVAGGSLELTIMDKDIYALLARTSYDNSKLSGAWAGYRKLNDYGVRLPVTVLQTPIITAKEAMDFMIRSRASIPQRLNLLGYGSGIVQKYSGSQSWDDIVLNYGMSARGGSYERLPGDLNKNELQQLVNGFERNVSGMLKASGDVANKAFHGYINNFDMAIRVQEYEALIRDGHSPRVAMRLAKRRGVNFSQMGSGISAESRDKLIRFAEEQYSKAVESGDKEAMKLTRKNLVNMRGYAGVSVRPGAALFMNNFAYKMLSTSAFGRSFVNSMDALVSEVLYERNRFMTGLVITAMLHTGAKSALRENGTAELYNQSEESPTQNRAYLDFGDGKVVPKGYTGIFAGGVEKVYLNLIDTYYDNAPDALRNWTKDNYPEMHKALENYESIGNNSAYVAFADAGIETFRYAPPLGTSIYRSAIGEDYAGRPTVPTYLEEGPSYLKTNSRTSNTMNQIAKYLESEAGGSFSPAKVEQFLSDMTGSAFGVLMNGADIMLNQLEIGPHLAKIKPGEYLYTGSFTDSEQVVPDEWKVSSAYYRLSEVANSKLKARDAIEKDLEQGLITSDEAAEFYAANDVVLKIGDALKGYTQQLKDVSTQTEFITRDVNPEVDLSDAGDLLGSTNKRLALDEQKIQRHMIMSDALEAIGNIPGADRFIKANVIDADSKTRFLVGVVNKVKSKLGITYEEPVEVPAKGNENGWDIFQSLEDIPVLEDAIPVKAKSLQELSDIYTMVPDDIAEMNKYVANRVHLPWELITRIQYAESKFKNQDNLEGTSTASGINQLTDSTFKLGLEAFGDVYGITEKHRGDPVAETLISMRILADDVTYFNRKFEEQGRLTMSEAYVVYHFGRGEGEKLLTALRGYNAATPVSKILSKDTIRANPSLLKDNPTVEELYLELQNKLYEPIEGNK